MTETLDTSVPPSVKWAEPVHLRAVISPKEIILAKCLVQCLAYRKYSVKAIITEKCSSAANLAGWPVEVERLFVNRLGGGLLNARTKGAK